MESDGEAADEIQLTDIKNYKCRWSGETGDDKKFDCTITKPQLDTTKFHTSKDKFLKDEEKTTITKDTIYKVQSSSIHLSSWSGTHENKKIEILKDEKEAKKYADIKPIFAMNDAGAQGKTGYFIGKIFATTASGSGELTKGSDAYKCSWTENFTDNQTCQVYDFDSSKTAVDGSGFENLTFQTLATESTTLKQHQHFLIKLEIEDNFLDLSKTHGSKMFCSADSAGDVTTTKYAIINNITPVVYDGQSNILII